jgi:hypothetical protein
MTGRVEAILKVGFAHAGIKPPFASKALLTESPRQCSTFYVFFPLGKGQITSSIPREKMELAHRKLYAHVYQAISSMIFAIASYDAIRNFSTSAAIIERANESYLSRRATSPDTYREDKEFESVVETSRQYLARVEELTEQLAQNPERHDLCKQLSDLAEGYRREVYSPVRDKLYGESWKELFSCLPVYRIFIDQMELRNYDEILQFLTGEMESQQDLMNMRCYRAGVGDIEIRLEANARSSTTFSELIPDSYPTNLDGVGLSISGSNRDKTTYLASFLEGLAQSLQERFDTLHVVEHNGTLIFCPKLDLLEQGP